MTENGNGLEIRIPIWDGDSVSRLVRYFQVGFVTFISNLI